MSFRPLEPCARKRSRRLSSGTIFSISSLSFRLDRAIGASPLPVPSAPLDPRTLTPCSTSRRSCTRYIDLTLRSETAQPELDADPFACGPIQVHDSDTSSSAELSGSSPITTLKLIAIEPMWRAAGEPSDRASRKFRQALSKRRSNAALSSSVGHEGGAARSAYHTAAGSIRSTHPSITNGSGSSHVRSHSDGTSASVRASGESYYQPWPRCSSPAQCETALVPRTFSAWQLDMIAQRAVNMSREEVANVWRREVDCLRTMSLDRARPLTKVSVADLPPAIDLSDVVKGDGHLSIPESMLWSEEEEETGRSKASSSSLAGSSSAGGGAVVQDKQHVPGARRVWSSLSMSKLKRRPSISDLLSRATRKWKKA